MLSYKDFIEKMKKEIKDFLPSEYKTGEIETKSIKQMYNISEGLCLTGFGYSAMISLVDLYEKYLCCMDLQQVFNLASARMMGELRRQAA